MGWPKGKPRKPKSSAAQETSSALKTGQVVSATTPDPVFAAGPKKRDPARRATAEIQKVLAKLEKARERVADLEKIVAGMREALGGPVPSYPQQIVELMKKAEEPSGPPTALSPQDNQGEGRWI